MHYRYKLRQVSGKILRGSLAARDEQEARLKLANRGGILLMLRPVGRRWQPLLSLRVRRTVQGIIKQLALMAGASLPLRESLALVIRQQTDDSVRQMLEDVYHQVCQGKPLSRALAEQPNYFDALCCATVAAGEHGGDLSGALNSYADFQDEQRRLHQALRQAVSYPLFLLVMSCLVTTVLLTVAVPQIVSQLTLSGVALPLSTRAVLAFGEMLQVALLPLMGAAAFAGSALYFYRHHSAWRYWLDALYLRLPLIGREGLRVQQVRMLMTLAILCRSAVPMADALRLSCNALSNRCFRLRARQVTNRLVEGEGFSTAIAKGALFPPDVLALLLAGEQGGRLNQTLTYLSKHQREALQQHLLGLVKLIEPVLILALGLVVLLVFMAIIQPMLTMNSFAF